MRSHVETVIAFFLVLILALAGCTPTGGGTTSGAAPQRVGDELLVGISTNAPPFAFKRGDTIDGLEVDFARQLSAYLGKTVRLVELPWKEQIPALEKKKIDIIMSGMTITQERSYRVSFSEPYMRSGQLLLVRSTDVGKFAMGFDNLLGTKPRIGTIAGTNGDALITKIITRPDLTRYKTSEQAVQALANEKIDVFFHDAPIVCHFAATKPELGLTPILKLANEEYLGWAVRKDNSALLGQLNAFLQTRKKDGGLRQTVGHWIPYLQ
jgi:ABC-type amino acid transport substrate-binding protein